MKIFIIILCFVSTHLYSQTYFSSIPDLGGDEMEGKIFNVIPLENEIKIIGLLHDSIVPGFDGGTWPVSGAISYTGELLGTNYLIDSTYSDGFFYFKRRLAFKNDSICYIYDRRDLGAPLLDAYLVEMNLRTGRILRSTIIYNQIPDHTGFLATDLAIGHNGNIYLVNVFFETGPNPQVLTVLDSNLTVQAQTLIPNFGRDNITKYVEEDSDGNLVLVGVSLGEANSIWFESKLFRQVLDEKFNSIDFKLASTMQDQTIAGFETYPIIKTKTGDWIFATQVAIPTNDCQDCSIWVPYIVCVSSGFTEVYWETRLFDGDFKSSQPEFTTNSIAEVSDGYIFAGSSDGAFGIETSGLLGKVSLNGDSLWLKHIIPIEWDTIQGRYFSMQDIKTTSIGNIVIGGYGSDRYTSRILPWILHLDKDGCLEPGCNITSTSFEERLQDIYFTMSPNPARDQCNIHLVRRQSTFSDFTLRVYNEWGGIMHELPLSGNDINLIVDLENIPAGNYFVHLMDNQNQQFSRQLIVVK